MTTTHENPLSIWVRLILLLDIIYLIVPLLGALTLESNTYDFCFRLGVMACLVGIYCRQRWGVIGFYALLIVNFVCAAFLHLGMGTHDVMLNFVGFLVQALWIYLALSIRKDRRSGWSVIFGSKDRGHEMN